RFFTANGTPASGPSGSPRARCASTRAAWARAAAKRVPVKALMRASVASMRAMQASSTSQALRCPLATACAVWLRFRVRAMSVGRGHVGGRAEDFGDFVLVAQGKGVQQLGHGGGALQVGGHARPLRLVQREPE